MKTSRKRWGATCASGSFETLENRVLFAFGSADNNFGDAGRAIAAFTSPSKTPAVQQLLLTFNNKILAAGTTGLSRFSTAGALDTTFGTSGRVIFNSAATFVAEAIDPANNNIYVLVSASGGTGLFRYTANGKLDTTYGSSGSINVTSAKTFQPQALTVQPDGKVIVAGVFKTDTNNAGRKVRIYRLKSDGSSDTSFGSTGSKELNLGQSSFLAPVIFDKVAGIKVLSGGKIEIIGGSIDYTPAFYDSTSGDYTPTSYDKASFVITRLTGNGDVDTTYATSGFARADYATAEQIAVNGIDVSLPSAFAVRSDNSIVLGGVGSGLTVGEFNAAGVSQYITDAGDAPQLYRPLGIVVLSDGRSVVVAQPKTFGDKGFSTVAISDSGEFGNTVFTVDDDTGTTDIGQYGGGGAAAVAGDGKLLVGGGDGSTRFVVEKLSVGSASDARPDEFADARANDIVKDSLGGLHLTYFNAATTHLMYAYRAPNGIWTDPVVIDSGANAGQYVSIDVNSKNQPGIAYFDGTNGDMRVALYENGEFSSVNIDSKGSVGLYPSFQFDNADEPVVTYYNKTKGLLTFALKKGNTTWGYENVDASGHNVGRSSVLLPSPKTGRYTVAYVDNTTGSVMWAGHEKGGTWAVKEAAKTKGGADFISMSYSYYYEPMISYYDAFAADLKIATYYNSQFNVKTLATSGAQGLYGAAYFGDYYAQGTVLAYNRTQNKVTAFLGVLGNFVTKDVVIDGGRYLSVDYDGSTTDLAYYDAATGVLKVRPGPAIV